MLRKVRVRDYMSRNLITLRSDDDVLHAIHALTEHQIGGAPVIDKDGNLIGLLTEKDCMQVVVDASYYSERGGLVSDYMSTEIEHMDANDSIVEAAERFLNKRYHRYPVKDNNRLVGVISRADVIRALGDYWQW